MYGVPEDLDLSAFDDAMLVQICLGEDRIQFSFQGVDSMYADTESPEIVVEGEWELRDSSGEMMDQSEDNDERESYKLHRLLGAMVVGHGVDAPHSFMLRFDSGDELRVFDSSEDQESFAIQPGDIVV
jgi:hypothetical protein